MKFKEWLCWLVLESRIVFCLRKSLAHAQPSIECKHGGRRVQSFHLASCWWTKRQDRCWENLKSYPPAPHTNYLHAVRQDPAKQIDEMFSSLSDINLMMTDTLNICQLFANWKSHVCLLAWDWVKTNGTDSKLHTQKRTVQNLEQTK